MKESVIYQDILQQGRQQEAFKLICLLLNRRFKNIDALLIDKVRALSTKQLRNLAEVFVDFTSVSDLETWLNNQ